MKIQDLMLREPFAEPRQEHLAIDPLTDPDALQEAQLVDVRFDAVRSSVGLIFELRMALQLDTYNTGVLIAHGVTSFAWAAPPRETNRTAWTVDGSVPAPTGSPFSLLLGLWPGPGGSLKLSARSAQFIVGDVVDLDETPPDYLETSDVELERQLARWDSTFEPAWASTR